jgi:GNAT superfamily N-acetyltransferase
MIPTITVASDADAADIVALRTRVAERLTREFGRGHWLSCPTDRSVLRSIATSRVLVARGNGTLLGTLRLATKKPWAIDVSYFTPVSRALYLHDMAVDPALLGRGIGKHLIRAARTAATQWPATAIRLDAYDAAAGASPFYVKCGFREVGRRVYRSVPLIYLELVFRETLVGRVGIEPTTKGL